MGRPQNSRRSARKPVGRPFEKGKSGNPGGRPKGFASWIRDETREGAELVEFSLKVLRGKIRASLKERQRARDWLADRGWGKAVQAIELSGPDGSPVQSVDLARLSDEQLEQLRALVSAASTPAAAAEGDRGGEGAPAHG